MVQCSQVKEAVDMKYKLTRREDATEWMWKLVGGD